MACFAVPVAEAVAVSAAYFVVKSKEKKYSLQRENGGSHLESEHKCEFSKKLSWLIKLLFGGSFLLAFEHLWHGEVVPWAPFLTAAADPADRAQMLHEMSTVGVAMALSVTALWAVMVAVSYALEKKDEKLPKKAEENL